MFSLLPFLVYWLAVQDGLRGNGMDSGFSGSGGGGGGSSSGGYYYPGIPAPPSSSPPPPPPPPPGIGTGMEGGGAMTMGTATDPLRGMTADAMAITPAVFDSQIEECIPQIATLLASTKVDGPPETMRRNRWIEQQVLEKCTTNVHLGLKVYWLLRAALGHLEVPTRRGLPQITGERQRAHLMNLLSTGEQLAREGRRSPLCLAPLRARYFAHCTSFVSALVRLSFELKQVSAVRRLTALHQGVDRVNTLLYRVMHTRGEEMEAAGQEEQAFFAAPQSSPNNPQQQPQQQQPPLVGGGMRGGADGSATGGASWLNEEHIARQCPDVAAHSVHLPLLDGANPVFRFLRLVSGECELLPSRERCPYLVVAELLQTGGNTRCGSAKLYTAGASLGCTAWDVLDGRQFPESLLYPEDHPAVRCRPLRPFAFNVHGEEGVGVGVASASEEAEEDYFLDLHAGAAYPGGAYPHPHAAAAAAAAAGGYLPPHQPPPPPYAHHSEAAAGAEEMDPRHMDPYTRRAVTVRKVFGELWQWKEQRIRAASPFGRLDGWRLAMFIVKAGDDLRQEQVAMQVIALVREIWREEGLGLWLRPYQILCVGDQAGLIEAVADAKSIDHIKKRAPCFTTLREYFERVYGGPYSRTFREAQRNFLRSLAGYCIVTYLLQVKDRHNANILLDKQGRLIHIDFGFMLGASPGSIAFESAPFKLTREYADVLGGAQDPRWHEFREHVVRGFEVLNRPRHRRRLLDLLSVSISEAPGKAALLKSFDERLAHAGAHPRHALQLVDESFNNYRTTMYDKYQKRRNNIAA